MEFLKLSIDDLPQILPLIEQINPDIDPIVLKTRAQEMFAFPNYYCFGCKTENRLIGVCGAWITTRLYSGKQLELDNVVVAGRQRSKNTGNELLEYMHAWALDQGCLTVELNAYVTNPRSHKFYHALGYEILGFHFLKQIAR